MQLSSFATTPASAKRDVMKSWIELRDAARNARTRGNLSEAARFLREAIAALESGSEDSGTLADLYNTLAAAELALASTA